MSNSLIRAALAVALFAVSAPSASFAQDGAKPKGAKMKALGKPNSALGRQLKGGAKVDLAAKAEPEAGKPEANLPDPKGKGKGKGKKGMEAGAEDVDARSAAVRARREAWRADPEGHKKTLRAEQMAQIRSTFGALVADAAVREELARHAKRMAWLDWAEETAVEKKDAAALARIDALRAKEIARHEKWMSAKTEKPAEKPAAGTDEGAAQ